MLSGCPTIIAICSSLRMRIADKRNHIVYSCYRQFSEESQTAVFLKFKVDKSDDVYDGKHLHLTIDELENLRDEAAARATRWPSKSSAIAVN